MRRVTPPHASNVRPGSEPSAKTSDRHGRQVGRAREQYFAGWRWRRVVEKELRALGLTFTQWLVLDSADELIEETEDAVNQRSIAERAELDAMTVSQVMKTLEGKDLVNREPDVSGRAYRVFVTKRGQKLLQAAAPLVENATRAAS
jgi:DNA-binding MarR family transcriptional regulator